MPSEAASVLVEGDDDKNRQNKGDPGRIEAISQSSREIGESGALRGRPAPAGQPAIEAQHHGDGHSKETPKDL